MPANRAPVRSVRRRDLDDAFSWEESFDLVLALYSLISKKYGEPAVDVRKLTPIERMVVLIYWLQAEVANGGFHQYFSNPSGEYAVETLQILQNIGAQEPASILGQALGVFQTSEPAKDQLDRAQQLANIDADTISRLGLLDERFYQHEDELFFIVRRYLEDRKSDFLATQA